MAYRFTNNAITTLGSSISPTATTITVATGTGSKFPALAAGQFFTATLIASGSSTGTPNEIVRVTARVGDTMTVVRGQEGSTAQSWSVGDTFANFITAGFLNQIVDSTALQSQSGNYVVDSGTANAGVVTLVPAPVSLAALVGVPIRVKKGGAASTGAYTLNVNSLGAQAVQIGGAALVGGELVPSQIYEVVYDGTVFNLISNPGVLQGGRLAANSVANAALAQMIAQTIKGNLTDATATPYDIPLATLIALLSTATEQDGGFTLTISGFIIKFGHTNTGDVANATIGFTTPFPTVCYGVVATVYGTGAWSGTDNSAFGARNITTTGFGISKSSVWGGGAAQGINWVAYGK